MFHLKNYANNFFKEFNSFEIANDIFLVFYFAGGSKILWK